MFAFAVNVSAASTVGISLNHAYLKGNNTYDVVVKESPGTKLALYVNDKNPVYATANKKDWATFHKVQLVNNGKISFAKVLGTKNKTYQKPVNYVRFFQVSDGAVTFLTTNPNQPTQPQTTTPTPTTQTVTPTPTATPQPTCTNGSYVNSAGNTVCSPETSSTIPAGATAQCVDGTYSFSQSRSGTCSHHGGVAQWL